MLKKNTFDKVAIRYAELIAQERDAEERIVLVHEFADKCYEMGFVDGFNAPKHHDACQLGDDNCNGSCKIILTCSSCGQEVANALLVMGVCNDCPMPKASV